MIVNKYKYGGGGSGSGVTPQEVQAQIDSALTPYWDSAATESAITEALSGISLDGYYTSAQTDEKIASAVTPVSEHLFDVEQVTASALTELHDGLLEVSARTVDMSGYYTSAQTNDAIAQAVSGLATEQYVQDALSGVNLDNYWTSAQTEDAISAATSGKADAANIQAHTGGIKFPLWNSQGIITGPALSSYWFASDFKLNGSGNEQVIGRGTFSPFYAPVSAGTAGEILVSTGNGAPVWSAVTMPDMSEYTPTSGFSTINGSAITNGGNIVIQGGGDMSNYWNSAETKSYVDSAATNLQNQLDTIDNVIPAAILDLNRKKVESQDVRYMAKLTQAAYDQLVLDDDVDPDTFYIIVNSI